MFIVSFREGWATDAMMYDSIIKILCTKLQHESELKDKEKFLLFHDMTDNWIIKGTNSSYEVLVSW